mgnify:CR=1 FL=1
MTVGSGGGDGGFFLFDVEFYLLVWFGVELIGGRGIEGP